MLDIIEEHSEKAGKATGVTPAKRAASMGVQRTKTFMGGVGRSMTDTGRRVTGVTGRMGEAMASLVNVPRTFVGRSVSALSVIIDGVNGSDQRDEDSQEGTVRTESPTHYMFGSDNGSGNLGVNGNAEKRKLSDIGKTAEDTIHEDRPLVVNTLAPILIASPPSAGGSSKAPDDVSALETTPIMASEPVEPARPGGQKLKGAVRRVSHNSPRDVYFCAYMRGYRQ